MADKITYRCPQHPEIVLFTEDLAVVKMLLAERPATCPKCKKSYYKWECVSRQGS